MTKTVTTVQLPNYAELDIKENLRKAKVEIGALALAEKMTSERTWEVAALASAATNATAGRPKNTGESPVFSISKYAEESGWIESGRTPDTLQRMVATYRKWKDIGVVPGCGFWAHYEYRNKTSELAPNTSYNEAKAGRSEEAAEQIVRSALSVVPAEIGVSVAAEYLDTDEAEEVLNEDEEATDHVVGAVRRSVSKVVRGKSKKKAKDVLGLSAMIVVLDLSGACAKFRELAADQPDHVLIAAGLDLLHETIRMVKGEEVSPEIANQTIEDLEEYLKGISS